MLSTAIHGRLHRERDRLRKAGRIGRFAHLSVSNEAIAAEVARRTTSAMVAFKEQSHTSSDRLETLTRWLIVFTAAVVLLTIVLVVHDLTR